jgi:hypothetical protein
MEPDRQQHDCPAICVIAHQYSSATFLSLRFHSRKENVGMLLNKLIISFLYLFKIP